MVKHSVPSIRFYSLSLGFKAIVQLLRGLAAGPSVLYPISKQNVTNGLLYGLWKWLG
jgi:hypothetical protein